MGEAAFIAGDWGTSRLRLYLCNSAGHVLARREAQGAAIGDCEDAFAAAVGPWDMAHGRLPAVLSGMVGSTIGWREVAYLACPARPQAIANMALRFQAQGRAVAILPGLCCRNPVGTADVMRGEEVQILGALRLHPEFGQGEHLFCLPGTHTKWVAVRDGAVIRFQTALSGELFEILRDHSVLARDGGQSGAAGPAFRQGLEATRSDADLLHLLFGTRSRVVTGGLAKSQASSYLSGLILGKDVRTALRLFAPQGAVKLVCTPALALLYDAALKAYNLQSVIIDGDGAALAGLVHAYTEIFS